MRIAERCHRRQVRDAEHLAPLGQRRQLLSNNVTGPRANANVDLVKDQRRRRINPRQHDFEPQQDA